MSFMFKPLSYDEWGAINYPNLEGVNKNSIIFGKENSLSYLNKRVEQFINNKKIVLIDGYIGADFKAVMDSVSKLENIEIIEMNSLYKTQVEIDEMTKENLPENRDVDPVLLFGKLFDGAMEDLIDETKIRAVIEKSKTTNLIVVGNGSANKWLRVLECAIVFVDVAPKNTAIRALRGDFANIGDDSARPFMMLMRRNYFVDFEVEIELRKELFNEDCIDLYISDNTCYAISEYKELRKITSKLVNYPFRAKPVYLEGIWGGEFIRKVRNLPKDMSENIAWIFEFIPMEVSIVVGIDDQKFEIPFSSFMALEGKNVLGTNAYKEFEGYFPIRFNYDDSYHSDGNMSVQVHPDEDFVIENYNEFGRQDEAYYVIATGHNAKTYVGFDEKEDPQEFIELMKESYKNGTEIDYRKYINSVDSKIGTQVMLPAGTIHSSGQNQFILELGSLTIGSYTYKVYDYNRRDKEGNPRPLHIVNGEKVLRTERNTSWVNENVCIEPIEIAKNDNYVEYVVGRTDLMYYETARIELKTRGVYENSNQDKFTVVTIVDGEKVKVYSKSNPNFSYEANFLDVIVIPNTIKDYVIENIGYQPTVIHKTYLKDGYKRYKNR